MKTPRYSVMTVTYNRPEMLAEAAASLRAQTRIDWEHLVLDAGSGPETAAALDAIAKDERVRRFRVDVNRDQPAAHWNELLDRARGEYLTFLDDDNTKEPWFLERMGRILDERPEVDVVTCGFLARFSDGTTRENHLNLQTEELLDERNTVDTGCFLIRRSAMERVGYFPLDIRTNEDWAMVRRMRDVLKMVHLPECLATWREHRHQRMKRSDDLGHAKDAAVILAMPKWKDKVGLRIHAPEFLGDWQKEVVRVARELPQTTSWIVEGDDVELSLFAEVGTQAIADKTNGWFHFVTKRGTDLDRTISCSFNFGMGFTMEVVDMLAKPRVRFDPFELGVERRLRMIVNAARSRRYRAEIP